MNISKKRWVRNVDTIIWIIYACFAVPMGMTSAFLDFLSENIAYWISWLDLRIQWTRIFLIRKLDPLAFPHIRPNRYPYYKGE